MSGEDGDTERDALTATVMTALRQDARLSVHPADLAALRRAAARIALALQADFFLVCRHSPTAELIKRRPVSERTHE